MASLSARARGITDILVHTMDAHTTDDRILIGGLTIAGLLTAVLKAAIATIVAASMDIVEIATTVATASTENAGNSRIALDLRPD